MENSQDIISRILANIYSKHNVFGKHSENTNQASNFADFCNLKLLPLTNKILKENYNIIYVL